MNQGASLSRSARVRGLDGEKAFSHNKIFCPFRQERPEPDRQRGVQGVDNLLIALHGSLLFVQPGLRRAT